MPTDSNRDWRSSRKAVVGGRLEHERQPLPHHGVPVRPPVGFGHKPSPSRTILVNKHALVTDLDIGMARLSPKSSSHPPFHGRTRRSDGARGQPGSDAPSGSGTAPGGADDRVDERAWSALAELRSQRVRRRRPAALARSTWGRRLDSGEGKRCHRRPPRTRVRPSGDSVLAQGWDSVTARRTVVIPAAPMTSKAVCKGRGVARRPGVWSKTRGGRVGRQGLLQRIGEFLVGLRFTVQGVLRLRTETVPRPGLLSSFAMRAQRLPLRERTPPLRARRRSRKTRSSIVKVPAMALCPRSRAAPRSPASCQG